MITYDHPGGGRLKEYFIIHIDNFKNIKFYFLCIMSSSLFTNGLFFFMKHAKIFVAGHQGMVGSALIRTLRDRPGVVLVTRQRNELDLRDAQAVSRFFAQECPQQVYLAAARVGGIWANATQPADFLYDNLMIQTNVIEAAYRQGCQRLLFLASSCIYPKLALQPIAEEALLSGPLEPTNEAYAIAKIAGLKLCESYNRQHGCDFRGVMPTNLYGPGDNYHPENSHVIGALIRRFEQAARRHEPVVRVWGTGTPQREFLHVDDLAEACVQIMALSRADYDHLTQPHASCLNVGSGEELTIAELAMLIANATGYQGRIEFDPSRPDGTPRKRLDGRKLNRMGWRPQRKLAQELPACLVDYLARHVGKPQSETA